MSDTNTALSMTSLEAELLERAVIDLERDAATLIAYSRTEPEECSALLSVANRLSKRANDYRWMISIWREQ